MNREAAAMSVPVYSIFRGVLGAVDRYLADEGRLTLIETPEDVISKIQVVKRPKGREAVEQRPALQEILTSIDEMLRRR
jgi:predicted glycosyltransferase